MTCERVGCGDDGVGISLLRHSDFAANVTVDVSNCLREIWTLRCKGP
jgi:hypothetical protein